MSRFAITVTGLMNLLLFTAVAPDVSAITAETVMENVLEVYEDIEDYKAIVSTYRANSMEVSDSELRAKAPLVTFNLFFRKPNEHAVKEINKSQYGVFRLELLSTLHMLKDYDLVESTTTVLVWILGTNARQAITVLQLSLSLFEI